MPYDPIQGQGQGHFTEVLNVRKRPISKAIFSTNMQIKDY